MPKTSKKKILFWGTFKSCLQRPITYMYIYTTCFKMYITTPMKKKQAPSGLSQGLEVNFYCDEENSEETGKNIIRQSCLILDGLG